MGKILCVCVFMCVCSSFTCTANLNLTAAQTIITALRLILSVFYSQ